MDIVTGSFREAARDYLHLLERDYPERPTLKLVGDRHRLGKIQRLALYRGIAPGETARSRRAKITKNIAGKKLYIDGYNQVFTFMNYLLGKLVFLANDGMLRDCGESYGKIENGARFDRSLGALLEEIARGNPGKVEIYFEESIQGSGTHREEVRYRLVDKGITGEVFLVKSADEILTHKTGGVVATSDSEIIENCPCPVVDLARAALEGNFKLNPLDINSLL